MKKTPKLFGTSGIRGVFLSGNVVHPVQRFVDENVITVDLAWLLGRAIANLHNQNNNYPVEIWQDVRSSGEILVTELIRGLQSGGAETIYRGIAPTTVYSMRSDSWVIVVTASHNPQEFNGFKVFREGRPLLRQQEIKLELLMNQWSENMKEPRKSDLKINFEPADDTRQIQFDYFRQNADLHFLKQSQERIFSNCFLPLDLAYGAAACPIDSDGRLLQLSPQLSVLLSLGFPVVGYGSFQDSCRTNNRIGAAYAYGETADQPEPDELSAFAKGLSGYGASAERIIFWPVNKNSEIEQKITRLVERNNISDIFYTLENDYTADENHVLIIHPDQAPVSESLTALIDTELSQRTSLPGFMVDCDADRILVTTPALACTGTPYLTGDGMIRFFAETMPAETYTEVAFTVESGLSLEIALERFAARCRKMGKRPFDIRKVTVGDRAIIDCFLEAGPGYRMGGEPSGHIIFCKTGEKKAELIDDPFITYIKLMKSVSELGGNLDEILSQLYLIVPDVYCARKPDSRAGTGLTLTEKTKLELWDRVDNKRISQYATVFIPNYIKLYGSMVTKVFQLKGIREIEMFPEWDKLLGGFLDLPETGWAMPVAKIIFQDDQELYASLYLDPRSWAGPEVIRIGFYYMSGEGLSVLGEGVFRNSGTSPKNAGYHKLWPENPWRDETVSEDILKIYLTKLAELRADFTSKYVEKTLRN